MKNGRRQALGAIGAASAGLWSARASAQGAAYPTRPIQLVIPFPPGGPTDLIARAAAPLLQESLGQPLVLDNRSGATGNIAAEYVARAPADGHVLILGNIAINAINAHVIKTSAFDAKTDLVPICNLVQPLMCVAVNPSVPVNSVAELVEHARRNPGKLRYASSGVASPHHLAGALMGQLAGIDWVHVPYRGGAPAVNDLVGGQVEVGFITLSGVLPFHQNGRVRILGMTETKRAALLPDVPSISETVRGFEMTNWQGLFGPARLPVPIVERLHAEFSKAYSAPSVKASLQSRGMEVIVGPTADFAAFVRREHERLGQLIRTSNITLD